jgi:hypothetical protein
MVYVAYGDVSKVQLKANVNPLDALLYTGFDAYLEVSPRRWLRAVDLPQNHPALVNFSAGAYKAGLTDANGQTFTILNAYNPTHRQLALEQGLHIGLPYNPDKREELLKTLDNIRESLKVLSESRFLELQNRIDKIKTRLEVLKGIRSLEREIAEREKMQATWDSTVNDAADMLEKIAELSSEIFPTNYERLAFKQAVQKAKKEAALETAVQESVLLNPELLKDLRRRLLED